MNTGRLAFILIHIFKRSSIRVFHLCKDLRSKQAKFYAKRVDVFCTINNTFRQTHVNYFKRHSRFPIEIYTCYNYHLTHLPVDSTLKARSRQARRWHDCLSSREIRNVYNYISEIQLNNQRNFVKCKYQ